MASSAFPEPISGIKESLLDAAGDIVYASADNTPARLAVGSTNQVLGVAGGIPAWQASSKSTLTTTGDILYASAANTPARLGIGSAGQVLNVASGIPAWTTISSGGMTLITTTTWDNTVGTYTYSSLGSYKNIVFVGQNLKHSNAAASSEWNLRLNSSTANSYGQSIMQMNGTTYSGTVNHNQTTKIILSVPAGSMLGASGGGANFDGDFMLTLPDYGSSQFKGVFWSGGSCQDGTRCMSVGNGHFSDTTAITSVTIFMTTGNFQSGTMRVYGVS